MNVHRYIVSLDNDKTREDCTGPVQLQAWLEMEKITLDHLVYDVKQKCWLTVSDVLETSKKRSSCDIIEDVEHTMTNLQDAAKLIKEMLENDRLKRS